MQVEGILSYGSEILCAFAGPAVNLMLSFAAAKVGVFAFAGLNLAMALFNLLPLGVLDGGRALSGMVSMLFGPERARSLVTTLELVLSVLLVLCGSAVLGLGGNVTLFVVSVWLVARLQRSKDKTWRKKGLSSNV